MDILNFCFKKVLLFSLLFAFNLEAYSQSTNNIDLISVKINVVGKGATAFHKDDDENYFTLAVVTNNQDTAISFMIMGGSWAVSNWIVDNDSIYLKFLGNDFDSPIRIKLLPHKSIDFYCILRTRKKDLANRNFKLGFYFTDIKDGITFSHTRNKSDKVYWSNSIKLEDKSFQYELE